MVALLTQIGVFADRMKVYTRTYPVPDELKKIVISFLVEFLKAIVSLARFMEAKVTGALALLVPLSSLRSIAIIGTMLYAPSHLPQKCLWTG